MIGRLLEGVPRRGLVMLVALVALLAVFPAFASGYLLAVGFLILYFAYVGQTTIASSTRMPIEKISANKVMRLSVKPRK